MPIWTYAMKKMFWNNGICRFCLFCILLGVATTTLAEVVFTELQLVSSERVGRTLFEYRYKVYVTNNGRDVSNVTATVASSMPATAIIDGTLSFNDIPAGGTDSSNNLLVFRQDRRNTFDSGALTYQFDYVEAPAKQSLSISIATPQSLTTTGLTPITISGNVSHDDATLLVNRIPVTSENGSFSADVELQEGYNSIVASIELDGQLLTDSITVFLDQTDPNLTVDSHQDGQTVFNQSITITGLINDVVRGSISSDEAEVRVNDQVASVNNRSYAATITLAEGENPILIRAVDKVGNTSELTLTLIYQGMQGDALVQVSGQNQTGIIDTLVSEPLVVRLLNADGRPKPQETVVFRVIQGDGAVGAGDAPTERAFSVLTNNNGYAQTHFKLGSRVGQANQKVRATVVGVDAAPVFTASGRVAEAVKIDINTGNNQRGAIGQRLPQPLVVYVTDAGSNPVAGQRVGFQVLTGEGHFTGDTTSFEVITNDDGFASANFWLGDLPGTDAQRVSATITTRSNTQISSIFTATAFAPADPGNTSLTGLVLDTEGNPLENVTLRIEDTNRSATTDEHGYFNLTEAPVGPVHLLVDGSTISNNDGEYPTLGFRPVLVAGIENTLPQPIYMVKLTQTNQAFVSTTQGGVVTMEDFPGYKLEIAPNSATFPDGSRSGIVSITAVNSNTVPMPPPNGMQPQLAVTIQPSGTLFDPSAPITLPNLDGLPPGQQIDMYSYDHDLEEFVSIGLGTVSEDGALVTSNPGVGILKAGWFIVPTPTPPAGNGGAGGDGDGEGGDGDGGNGDGGDDEDSDGDGDGEDPVSEDANDDINDPEDCTDACNNQDSNDDDPNKPDDDSNTEDENRQDEVEEENNQPKDENDPQEAPEQRENETDPDENTGADPIVMATGELLFTQTDLKIPGRGFDFELKRTYRSRTHFNGRLGYNWVFNYDQELVVFAGIEARRLPADVTGQAITWAMPDGRQYVYTPNGDGSYTSPKGIFDTLTRHANGSYTVRKPDGFKLDFDAEGRMTAQRDRNDNIMHFGYDPQGPFGCYHRYSGT